MGQFECMETRVGERFEKSRKLHIVRIRSCIVQPTGENIQKDLVNTILFSLNLFLIIFIIHFINFPAIK